jgi:hypothetical protein
VWKRISEGLVRISTGWVTLGVLAVFRAFAALVLPAQSARAGSTSAADVGIPDLKLYYSPDRLYRMADAYGVEGRAEYIRVRLTFDMVWPLVYAALLATAISRLFGRAFPPGNRWRLANLAPLPGVLLDYLENISTSLAMARYPTRTPVVAFLAPLFTVAKWVFVAGSFALLTVGVGLAVRAWRRGASAR